MKSKSKYELDAQTISQLFVHAGIGVPDRISPLGAGEYNSVYAVDVQAKAYALKVAPVESSAALTYESDMLRQEIYYYTLMRDRAKIRVPEVYFCDFSRQLIPAQYFIMERLNGKQLDQAQLTRSEKEEADREVARMTARMHAVRGEGYGYLQNGLKDTWYSALRSMVQNLIADAARFGKKSRRGNKLLQLIDRYRAVLEQADCRLINFDIWGANILCERKGDKIELSWIDPERCMWGDRIADFVCLEFGKFNLADKKKTLDAYNAVSDAPVIGTADENIRFGIMLCYLGLIMEVEKYARYSWKHFGWWRNVVTGKLVFSRGFKILKREGRL